MQLATYFAHAGHKHLDDVASSKGSDVLILAGVAVIIVGTMVVGLVVWDGKRRKREQ